MARPPRLRSAADGSTSSHCFGEVYGAGLAGALAVGRSLSGLLFEVSSRDPMALAVVAIALVAVAAVACCLPARRATLDDPIRALRRDG